MKETSKDALLVGDKYYFTGKPCKNGHVSKRQALSRRCWSCKKEQNNETMSKKRESMTATEKSELKCYMKKYTEKNKTNRNERQKKLYKNSVEFKITCLARGMLRRSMINKKDRTFATLGYTSKQLKLKIEGIFLDGMSWKNYGEWHVDHIKPIALFIREGIEDPKVINALSNLQPLWAKDNRIKGCKY